jgi:hypothetical protein
MSISLMGFVGDALSMRLRSGTMACVNLMSIV